MISLKTADNALKNVYLDVIKNQLDNEVDPFYSKIVKTESDIAGNEIKKMVTIGISGGIGAGAEDGVLPSVKDSNYAVLTTKLKNLYAQLEISDKAIRASQSESGAFLNLLNAEMDNLIESSKFNLRRMLYGNGSNLLSYTDTNVSEGDTVFKVNEPYKFMVGMKINVMDSLEENVGNMQNIEILDVDYINGTITVPTFSAYDGGYELPLMIYYANSATNEEIVGLNAILDAAAYPKLYGLQRSNNTFLTPVKNVLEQDGMTFANVLKCIDDLKENYNANTDLIVCGHTFRRQYQQVLKNFAINADIVTMEGGYKATTINGVPIYANRFMNTYWAYVLDSSTFKLHQLCDWTWLSNDKGEILHQKDGYAVQTATLVKYCDLICDRPCKNSIIVCR